MTLAARERSQVRSPMLIITAVAWIALLLAPGGSLHVHHVAHLPLTSLAAGWVLMSAAMMTPMLIAPVRHVRNSSFARRRARAIALFVAAYAAVWMAAGCVLLALAVDTRVTALTVAIVALVWQLSPIKQRCLNRCHAHSELAAFGPAAHLSALRFGCTHGIWCVGSCWAMMLLPLLVTRGHILLMAAVSLWLIAERFERPFPPCWRWRGPATALRIAVVQTRMLLHHP